MELAPKTFIFVSRNLFIYTYFVQGVPSIRIQDKTLIGGDCLTIPDAFARYRMPFHDQQARRQAFNTGAGGIRRCKRRPKKMRKSILSHSVRRQRV